MWDDPKYYASINNELMPHEDQTNQVPPKPFEYALEEQTMVAKESCSGVYTR